MRDDDLLGLLLGCGCQKRCCCGGTQAPTPAARPAALLQQTGRHTDPPRLPDESPFVPPPPVVLAPLPSIGAGVSVGVGPIVNPQVRFRTTLATVQRTLSVNVGNAMRALNVNTGPYEIRDAPSSSLPTHAAPALVGSTVSGGQVLMLYALEWAGQNAEGFNMVGGLPGYVLASVNPLTGVSGIVDSWTGLPGGVPGIVCEDRPADPGEWVGAGQGHSRPHPTDGLGTLGGQRHLVVSTPPGSILAASHLRYLQANPVGSPTGDEWTGVGVVTAGAGGISVQFREVDIPLGTQLMLGASGGLSAESLWYMVGSEGLGQSAILYDMTGNVGGYDAPAGDALLHAYRNNPALRHGSVRTGSQILTSAGGGSRIVTPGGGITASGLSAHYPGWYQSSDSNPTLNVPRPEFQVDLPALRNLGEVSVTKRVRIEGMGTTLRVADTVGGLSVQGVLAPYADLLLPPGTDRPAGPATVVPYERAPIFGAPLAPVLLTPLQADLPTRILVPTVSGWTQLRPLPDGDTSTPPLARRAALRAPADTELTATWAASSTWDGEVQLLITARASKPGWLYVYADNMRLDWLLAPDWFRLPVDRAWRQYRSVPIVRTPGTPLPTLTIYGDTAVQISQLQAEFTGVL